MNELQGRRVVLGVTGGVAAYKAAELTRLLVKSGAAVDVVLTAAGAQFVGAPTFQALSGRPVWHALWDERQERGMAHIDLTRGADALLVAPATADFMAKVAHGFADDLLSTLCLARDCPLLVAPAMNRQMWNNPATRRNVAQLHDDGVRVLGPAFGEQACGEVGEGRMLESAELLDELVDYFQPKLMRDIRVLLTAGPTYEAVDPVRGLTNISSGKMGFALARACVEAGAEVTLVAGPCDQPTPRHVRRIDVRSALEMRTAVLAELDTELQISSGQKSALAARRVFISVAAVADYRPKTMAKHKLKKSADDLLIELEANPDILAEVAALSEPPFCVGFAAESRDLAHYSEGKRRNKRLGMVVGNLVQDGMGGDRNVVTLFDAKGNHPLPPADKLTVARGIIAHLAQLLEAAHA